MTTGYNGEEQKLLRSSCSTHSILEKSNSQFTSLCWHRFQATEPFITAETTRLHVADVAAPLHEWHSRQVEAEVE